MSYYIHYTIMHRDGGLLHNMTHKHTHYSVVLCMGPSIYYAITFFDFFWPTHYRLVASNFKSFSRSLEHFFLTVGQNNFGNKITTLFPKINYDFKQELSPQNGCYTALLCFHLDRNILRYGREDQIYSLFKKNTFTQSNKLIVNSWAETTNVFWTSSFFTYNVHRMIRVLMY